MIKYLILSVFLVFHFKGVSNNNLSNPDSSVTNNNQGPFKNEVYQSYIKTLRLHKAGYEESYPIIKLNSGEQLQLSFDDLQADYKDYQYTVVHCTDKWEKSDLKPFEYLEGYQTDLIEESQPSFRTTFPYTHYSLLFPNDYLRITKSGNYIIKVFIGTDEADHQAFTLRFMVVNPKALIEGKVQRAFTDEETAGYNQKIVFSVFTKSIRISNPYQNLKIVITQNRRWDNALYHFEPTSVLGDQIIYDHLIGNDFPSGNEYRNFDTKDLRHQTEFIAHIENTPEGYFVDLKNDKKRTFKPYYSEHDLNGRSLIRAELGRDPAIEGEYVYVNFYFPYAYPLTFGDVHILGQLNNWEMNKKSLMDYNYKLKRYENTLLLKQGYHNYMYGFLEKDSKSADVTLLEGNHWETNNEYMIYVYYLAPGTTYDQLIGIKLLQSHPR